VVVTMAVSMRVAVAAVVVVGSHGG
jgi:hypothetical protein